MISFDVEHQGVHYPKDRRFRIWIRPSILIWIGVAILSAVAASRIEVAIAGLPHIPPIPQIYPSNFAGPHGFPLWVRYCHFFNFLFVMMLIRSGLSILVDHPRLYFNDDCMPGSEWIRFTPLKVPRDRVWTAKDDARYISPLVGPPAIVTRSASRESGTSSTCMDSFSPEYSSSSCSSIRNSGDALCPRPPSCSYRPGIHGFITLHFICLLNPTDSTATTRYSRSPLLLS